MGACNKSLYRARNFGYGCCLLLPEEENRLMKKIGIIGCGHWGRNYIRILRELKQYIVMCCDTNENSLSWVKETYPFVAVTKSVNDVVSAPDMDAVIISTPSVTHYEIITASISGALTTS